ncbi:hypothetical protein [Streptomyces sp. AK02-01A]|uniref:hypothetical protein n=1 Tax=Streptomyces sp. AK02-01A TaxID=3028648 RepID=UPI0029AF47BF|nr:hypothetical protein [Streptomyces sp. AK02-01A]MDX3852260.1 hypothetical protein [Streptomyces sp. AK02-01A]
MSEDEEAERPRLDELPEELRALGRGIRIPDVDGETMAERVLAQLLAEAVPVPAPGPMGRTDRVRGWLRGRWRMLAAALSGLVVVLVLTPPVRASVADWFGFGGVEVRYDPSAGPRPAEPVRVPGCDRPVTPAEAARRAGFTPRVPAGLGPPDAMSLRGTPRPEGRGAMVSLCWTERGRTLRLDEFAASLDMSFVKQVRVMPQWLELSGGTGVWFEEPHVLRFRLVSEDGEGWTETARPAGPTLLWDDGDIQGASAGERLTLRLEGVESLARARAIAESVR